jgi:ATP-dependent DNA helicase RecG
MKHRETIEELLQAKEGESYQFKEAKNRFDFEEACKCCCALSNVGGGKLVFGVSDKRPRKVVGSKAFEQPERTRLGFIERLHVMVDFELYDVGGKRALVFDVAGRPAGLPIQYEGIAWWYEGDKLTKMSEEMRRAIYAETGHDFSAEVCHDAVLEDLDETAIQAFREKWVAKSGNKRLASLTIEQLMIDCGALTKKGITYAALILFGKKEALREYLPQSEIVFEYRSRENAGPAAQREEFRRGFFAIYDSLWGLINLRNNLQHYYDGFVVLDIPTFNEEVTREAILNAVSHRNYQYSGSIFVRQYGERLEIESPGGFLPEITANNILNHQAPRNRLVAEIFALSGFVERSGQGMNLIYEHTIREAKELPSFKGTDAHYVFLTLFGKVLDDKLPTLMLKIGDERLESFSIDDFLVVYKIFFGIKLSDGELSNVNKLIGIGVLALSENNYPLFNPELYQPSVRVAADDEMLGTSAEDKRLVLLTLRRNLKEGTRLKELLAHFPSYSRRQVQVLLSDMQQKGIVHCVGKGVAARWFIISK